MADPDWLTWTRELQAIAQTGLAFDSNGYDREGYEMLRSLASRMMAAHTSVSADRIEALFAAEKGYATPKVDVRGAVFDGDGRLLMVREVADDGRWTLPGGWADVNLTPAENVVKEVAEESGYRVGVRKLAAAWDRTRQGHASGVFSCCKLFYVCDVVGGAAQTGPETSEVCWFAEGELPRDLSRASCPASFDACSSTPATARSPPTSTERRSSRPRAGHPAPGQCLMCRTAGTTGGCGLCVKSRM